MDKETMTKGQLLYQIELLFEKRKRRNRAYGMKALAAEIGLTRTTLYDAIRYRRASFRTIEKMSNYLEHENVSV